MNKATGLTTRCNSEKLNHYVPPMIVMSLPLEQRGIELVSNEVINKLCMGVLVCLPNGLNQVLVQRVQRVHAPMVANQDENLSLNSTINSKDARRHKVADSSLADDFRNK